MIILTKQTDCSLVVSQVNFVPKPFLDI